jgi:hypothetical protein
MPSASNSADYSPGASPQVLGPAASPMWLGEEPADPRQLKAPLAPFPSEAMTCWPVSARVGNVKNNGPAVPGSRLDADTDRVHSVGIREGLSRVSWKLSCTVLRGELPVMAVPYSTTEQRLVCEFKVMRHRGLWTIPPGGGKFILCRFYQ